MSVSEKVGEAFITAFERLGVDPEMAQRGAQRYATVGSWTTSQISQAGAVGGAAMALPGWHHAGGVVDLSALVHKMAVMTWGVGYKLNATVDARLDLANVLAMWSGTVSNQLVRAAAVGIATGGAVAVSYAAAGPQTAFAHVVAAQVAGKVAGVGAGALATKLGAKGAAKGAATGASQIAAAAMRAAAPKIGAKMAAKFGAKHVVGWVPVLGAAAGAGINVWVMTALAGSAKEYFTAKAGLRSG